MKMLTVLFLLAIFGNFFLQSRSQWSIREYYIEKDFFSGIKSGEFSIYDSAGRTLLYRLESRYAWTQSAELVVFPSKQIVATINGIFSPFTYNSEIRVLDPFSNQWMSGSINRQHFSVSVLFEIRFGFIQLIARKEVFSLTTEIVDQSNPSVVLARIRKRFSSMIWSNKYDLQVYSNNIPDAVYFLAVAALDFNTSNRRRS